MAKRPVLRYEELQATAKPIQQRPQVYQVLPCHVCNGGTEDVVRVRLPERADPL